MATWESLAEMDLRFARSRRRAWSRRKVPRNRHPVAWRRFRVSLLALALLTLLAASTRLERSNATGPARVAAARPVLNTSCPVPGGFRAAFTRAAEATRLPLTLLVATAYEESRMQPNAESGAGARGLLQLMPATAQAVNLAGDDPAANVLAGARYLRQMINRFGTVDLALAAYNAGPTAVERAGGAPTIETLRYVKNVEARAGLLAC
jgi:soluble lytic murein transglycosylase-like protein